jgi:hypothetical protein
MQGMRRSEDPEHLAVLVVRAWRHGNKTVVARITYSTDGGGPDRVATEAGVDAIVAVVRSWLTALARDDEA